MVQAKGRGKNPKFPFTAHLMYAYHSGLGCCDTSEPQYLRAYNRKMLPSGLGHWHSAGGWGLHSARSLTLGPWLHTGASLSPPQEGKTANHLMVPNTSTHKRYTWLWLHFIDQGEVCELADSKADGPVHLPWAQKDTESGHVSITC